MSRTRQTMKANSYGVLGWPLLLSKPSAKALPGQDLVIGGVSVEKPWERPKGRLGSELGVPALIFPSVV